MFSRRRWLGLTALAASAGNQPVRWIVPNPPGGGYDAYSRLLKPYLEREIGVAIRIDNIPGAGGLRGAVVLSESPPDGSTLGIVNMPGLVMAALTGERSVDPVDGFTLLGVIADSSYLWVTGPSSGIGGVENLAAIAKGRGLVFAVNSPNNVGYIASALALRMLGWRARFVSGYSGSAEKILAVVRGDVDVAPLSWDSVIPHARSGELRPVLSIAVDTVRRFPLFRGLPALDGPDGLVARLAPKSLEDIEATVRFMQAGRALAAPSGLPPDLAKHLRQAVCRTLSSKDLAAEADARGAHVQPACAVEAERRLRAVRKDAVRLATLTPAALRGVQR